MVAGGAESGIQTFLKEVMCSKPFRVEQDCGLRGKVVRNDGLRCHGMVSSTELQ